MNPYEQDNPGRQDTPPPETTRPDRAETPGAPEAIQAADVTRTTGAKTETADVDPALRKARGVDWVRTSDLMARGTGQISRLAIDFEANLAHKAHDGLARGVTRLGAKEREMPPISAFGRSTSRDGAGRGPVGMN